MGLFGGKKKNTKENGANSAEELLRLAEQYDTGNGISMDRERATELYQQAAGMGDAKAQEVLGERYEEGIGTETDLDKALFWYEQAVSGGREYAAYSMAYLLNKLERWDEAFQWAMIAANMGSVGAKRLLGRLYYNGTGTEKDIAEAVGWWDSAAKEGDAQAARFVASVYYDGELGRTDLEKAFEYYKIAADGGESNGGCFLTSACTEAMGLADDCYELTVLRRFRDTYLQGRSGGGALIRKYYEVAPEIVRKIKQKSGCGAIWQEIYREMVQPCVLLIEKGRYEEALEHYKNKTERLMREM